MFDIIVNTWKDEIESINIDGYSRFITSVDFFSMQSRYYPHSLAYKLNFNFRDGISEFRSNNKSSDLLRNDWDSELRKLFISKFGDKWKEGPNSGELQFHNNLCDYMTYQGYRLIIQFYPDQFLPIIRDKKLNEIGI
jgi:hypothetical protein